MLGTVKNALTYVDTYPDLCTTNKENKEWNYTMILNKENECPTNINICWKKHIYILCKIVNCGDILGDILFRDFESQW